MAVGQTQRTFIFNISNNDSKGVFIITSNTTTTKKFTAVEKQFLNPKNRKLDINRISAAVSVL